jgi:hypothetical protein
LSVCEISPGTIAYVSAHSLWHPKGPEDEAEIASLAVHNNDVFASAGSKVVRYQRGKQVAVYQASAADVKLGQILIFGEQLLALRQDGRGLLVWKISTLGRPSSIALSFPQELTSRSFRIGKRDQVSLFLHRDDHVASRNVP